METVSFKKSFVFNYGNNSKFDLIKFNVFSLQHLKLVDLLSILLILLSTVLLQTFTSTSW